MANQLIQKLLEAGFEQLPSQTAGPGSALQYQKGSVLIQFIDDYRNDETTLQRCDNGELTERTSNPQEFDAMLTKWLTPSYVPPTPGAPKQAEKKGCLAALFGIK